MAQVSYGTITITDTNDIERIYTVYAKSATNTDIPTAAASAWKELISEAPGTGNYIWQRTVVQKSGTNEKTYSDPVCLTGEEGGDGKGISSIVIKYGTSADWNTQPSTWYDNTPEYNSGTPNYWTQTTINYTTGNPTVKVTQDKALTQAIYESAMANSIAQSANENANGALSQADQALRRVQAKYGTSSTGAATSAKVAVCEGFELFNGAEVFIQFTNKNTVANPTLNVNNTGAKPIKDSDGGTLAEQFYWKDNSLVHFVYDGTNWRILDIVTTEKYNNLVSDINGVSSTVGQHTEQISGLGTRVSTNETNISQNATDISLKVSESDFTGNNIVSKINLNSTSATISAERVNIEGATIFTSGRLSTTNLNNTIDGRIPNIPDDLSDLTDTTGIIPDISGLASKTDTVKSVTTETQYRLSNSSTGLTGSGTGYSWSTIIPTWSNNTYLWTRIATTYTPISGTATTVYKPGTSTNEYGIYDSQLTIALSTANTANTNANNAAATITTTQQYRLSTSSTNLQGSGTGYTWNSAIPTWVANTYLWTRFKIDKTTVGGTTTTSYTPGVEGNEYGIYDSALTTALSTATLAKNTADAAAPKSDAIAEEQRIYYRSKVNTKPSGNGLPPNNTWVTNTTNIWNENNTTSTVQTGTVTGWTRKITPISKVGTDSTTNKYLYLWTCIQKKTVSGTVTYGDILLDDSTTIIDGGNIITGTVTANQLNATSINASGMLTIGSIDSTTQNSILNSELADDIAAAEANASYSIEVKVTNIDYANSSATLVAVPYYQGNTTLPTLPNSASYSYRWYKGTTALSNTSTPPTISGATTTTLILGQGSDLEATYVCVISKP